MPQKPFAAPVPKHRTVVSSFSQTVEIGPKPVIIGERINPTGKSRFKAALRENNIEYILGEGMAQEDSGAHILDVNVGLPEIDEPAMMERVVTRLQSVIALPLQIDTSNTEAMERGMRLYNGKPMINSVSGKMESMEAVFPLVRKYGGVVVGLALDENGIPATAEGRIQVARKIYETAEKYGIPHEDIVIDGLAMTISSDSGSALVTLETLRRVRDELHGHSILGVSNISFGLPQREIVNSNFFTMALQSGLSCAIINPNMDAMMRSYRAYLALANLDEQCAGYIAAYGNQPAPSAAPAAAGGAVMPLGESIERGLGERAVQAAKEMLQTAAPLDVVNGELIPALDRVGKGFEKGTVFLPQLLMSAEAAKAAFEVVKEAMKGEDQQTKGKIILATVKGRHPRHRAKNIVKVLLENYAYQVLDLGKDVPPEVIVDTAIREDIKVVGLSALMTTTVVSMEETIRQLREKKPDTKVVVGGAVLTQEYRGLHRRGLLREGRDGDRSLCGQRFRRIIQKRSISDGENSRICLSHRKKTMRFRTKGRMVFVYLDAITSFISYMPDCVRVAMYSAASTAPTAKTSRESAVCLISMISSRPQNSTLCSPTIVPPRTAEMPISCAGRFSRRSRRS